MVSDFCESVKTILGENNLTTGLHEKYFRATPDSVAVVDDHHFDATQVRSVGQFFPPGCPSFLILRALIKSDGMANTSLIFRRYYTSMI
ncbi:hypothetical protein PROAA_860014 [Candidatus Propionivibrio aalborgensis]|uniref:Uncharacterized protein n=1 Tax=Candidatus Propionivibrio aalborgensis TaxID=1860101 RepID=A0A1A8Y281_9RHOO|nr:hypothetical protein PROAA_860014 [Candidatus Propionivibrio aalborgensis]